MSDQDQDDAGSVTRCVTTGSITMCDRDTKDNVWVERGPNPGDELCIGICLLDTLSEPQIIHVIERDDRARQDLLRVTSDARLLEIARTVPRLPTVEESDEQQKDINRSYTAASIPFYAIFQGRPPGQ
jgi:hypothetical protein